MDGLLFNLLWSCGRQAELGYQPVTKEDSLEGSALAFLATDVMVNNPAGETGNSTTQSETSITFSPVTGTYCSAFNDSWEFYGSTGGGGFTGFSRSFTGGASWQDRGAVGATAFGDPSLVWRKADGFFYLATLDSGGGLAIWRSTDDCGDFTLLSIPTTGGDDKEILIADNNPTSPNYGNLYLVWTDFGASGTPIRAIRSTNGGVTWSAPVDLSAAGVVQGAWPAVSPNGDVFVAWLRYASFPSGNISIEVARSNNGGVSYTAVTSPLINAVSPRDSTASSICGRPALNGNIRYLASPQIAVDGNGVLHVVYSQDPDGFNSGDVVNVYYRRSTDGGATWNTAVQLNDVATGDQYFPTIQANGSILVAGWYDRRNDSGNFLQDYYKRISTDGGLTWGLNQRVTDFSSGIYLDPGTASCYHGDYDQSVVTSSGHVMQWADDRRIVGSRNDPDVWTDAFVGSQIPPPTAKFTFTCSFLTCTFNGTSSTGTGLSYAWSFGDSGTGTGSIVNHTYGASGVYSVTLTVTDSASQQASKTKNVSVNGDPLAPAEGYFAVAPCRILDTRNTTILTNGQTRVVGIAGSCGIPSTAHAVSFNVTAVSPTGSGKIRLFPGDLSASWPGAMSSIHFAPTTSPRANSAVIRLATNGTGTLGIYPEVSGSPGQVHLVLDVQGYFSTDTTPAPGAQGPLGFQTLSPCRLADTRASSPLVSGTVRNFTAQGVCGVPAGSIVASLHVGVPAPASSGFITLFPSNIAAPGVSTINFQGGIGHLRNGARVNLSPTTPDFAALFSGTAGATAHAYFDANGYFKSDAPLKYHPFTPCRPVDSALLVTDTVSTFQVQGNCGIPVGAKAALVRLVISAPTSSGDLTVYPSNLPLSGVAVSTVKFDANEPGLSMGTIVPLSTLADDLAVSPGQMTAGGTVVVSIDVFGYFQ